MNSLFSKILLSLIVTVFIALALVMWMTRVNLNRGMIEYIERQEAAQLAILVPELGELYRENGSWEFLQDSPRRWNRLLRLVRPGQEAGHPHVGPGPRERGLPGSQPPRSGPGGIFRGRLFLLDENRRRIAGAADPAPDHTLLEAIEVDGRTVGWVGFAPLQSALPPEARLFLQGQTRALLISLVLALLVALGLGFVLARHFSRPLEQLTGTVDTLSDGKYEARAEVATGDEIGRLGTGINRLAETLSRNQSMRRRWMADVAHELRTPVSVLKGEIEAIQDGLRPADKKTLASLGDEAEHLSRLVNDLQTLALSDAGALDIRMEPVELSDLVAQQVQSFEPRLEERGIAVTTRLQDGIVINGDLQRLRQLMHNLLENICRYVVDNGSLEVSLGVSDSDVTLLLDDSGPGLSSEHRERLFDRFYRADTGRSRAKGGSGLGLSICRNIVVAHHGRIAAEASPIGGLRIRVELPARGD